MKQRPSYRVAAAGLDPRDMRLIEIVFGHGQYNRYEFVLLDRPDPALADLLIVDAEQEAGQRAIAEMRASGRNVPTIGAVARDASTDAKHSISIDRLTLQLLPILNRVVEIELLAAPRAGASRTAGTGAGLIEDAFKAITEGRLAGAPDAQQGAAVDPLTRPLPSATPPATAAATAPAAVRPTARPGPQRPPLRALVVDDSPTVRQQLMSAFERFGLAVEAVASGEQALRRLADGHVDLMTLDINLPGIDGFTVLRALREESRWRRLPVVVLSSRASPIDRARGLLAGADVYLAKPVQLVELHRIVMAELRRSVGTDDLSQWLRLPAPDQDRAPPSGSLAPASPAPSSATTTAAAAGDAAPDTARGAAATSAAFA